MESNGKSVDLDGSLGIFIPLQWSGVKQVPMVSTPSSVVTPRDENNPCEFLVAAQSHEMYLDHHHKSLLSNCFAQSEALMQGAVLRKYF